MRFSLGKPSRHRRLAALSTVYKHDTGRSEALRRSQTAVLWITGGLFVFILVAIVLGGAGWAALIFGPAVAGILWITARLMRPDLRISFLDPTGVMTVDEGG